MLPRVFPGGAAIYKCASRMSRRLSRGESSHTLGEAIHRIQTEAYRNVWLSTFIATTN
jgi:hypothetical protein